MEKIKENAEKILYKYGLIDELNKHGKTHIIGSYKMDLMVWNDLDIDIENENINMNTIHNPDSRSKCNKDLKWCFET